MSRDMTDQQNESTPSENSDKPEYPPSGIRVFAVRSVGNYGSKLYTRGQRKL